MIFRPRLVNEIVAGRKTQTRRRVKSSETECPFKHGRSYAVQAARGRPATARIVIVETRPEQLGEISFEDARAEGFRSRDEFFGYWGELYGSVDLDLSVWVLSFVLDRSHHPRLLAARSEMGYVENERAALRDHEGNPEPEAVEPDVQDRFSREARLRDEVRGLLADPSGFAQRDIARKQNKLRKLQLEARHARVDIGAELDEAIASIQGKIVEGRRAA